MVVAWREERGGEGVGRDFESGGVGGTGLEGGRRGGDGFSGIR